MGTRGRARRGTCGTARRGRSPRRCRGAARASGRPRRGTRRCGTPRTGKGRGSGTGTATRSLCGRRSSRSRSRASPRGFGTARGGSARGARGAGRGAREGGRAETGVGQETRETERAHVTVAAHRRRIRDEVSGRKSRDGRSRSRYNSFDSVLDCACRFRDVSRDEICPRAHKSARARRLDEAKQASTPFVFASFRALEARRAKARSSSSRRRIDCYRRGRGSHVGTVTPDLKRKRGEFSGELSGSAMAPATEAEELAALDKALTALGFTDDAKLERVLHVLTPRVVEQWRPRRAPLRSARRWRSCPTSTSASPRAAFHEASAGGPDEPLRGRAQTTRKQPHRQECRARVRRARVRTRGREDPRRADRARAGGRRGVRRRTARSSPAPPSPRSRFRKRARGRNEHARSERDGVPT